jgi:hypothetical protein
MDIANKKKSRERGKGHDTTLVYMPPPSCMNRATNDAPKPYPPINMGTCCGGIPARVEEIKTEKKGERKGERYSKEGERERERERASVKRGERTETKRGRNRKGRREEVGVIEVRGNNQAEEGVHTANRHEHELKEHVQSAETRNAHRSGQHRRHRTATKRKLESV